MLLEDESHVIKWLSQYGALPKTQLIRMLRKPPRTAEKILDNLKRDMRIADIGDGYYCALDPLAKPDVELPTSVDDLAIGGLGIFMVKNLVDDLHYERVDDANVVTILKKW